jgi:2-amino-4-hydroxy-6-hydroxymethyldihydropteridine diphosphokinase
MNKVYVALGSNLQDPLLQLQSAVKELAHLPQTRLIKVSSFYQNPPIGELNQPDFVNAVAKLTTELTPEAFLQALFAIENTHHRIRREKNGPRTLDLDLLLYEEVVVSSATLQVPHPRMKERDFVIYPLAEIEPHLTLPCGMRLHELVGKFSDPKLQLISVHEVESL